MKDVMKFGIAAGVLFGLGLGGANAAGMRPVAPEALGLGAASEPVAMCGHSCRSGGRYIPGPPGVCYQAGLNFCGPSGGGYGGPPPGRGAYGGGPGPYGRAPGYGGGPGPGYGGGGPPAAGRTWYGYGPGRCGWTLC